jgi:hypothetical protein
MIPSMRDRSDGLSRLTKTAGLLHIANFIWLNFHVRIRTSVTHWICWMARRIQLSYSCNVEDYELICIATLRKSIVALSSCNSELFTVLGDLGIKLRWTAGDGVSCEPVKCLTASWRWLCLHGSALSLTIQWRPFRVNYKIVSLTS